MLKMTFFLLFVINTILMGAVLFGGFKIVFVKGKYLNGLQVILMLVLIVAAFYMAFNEGIECDQSIKFLDYADLIKENPSQYKANPYDYFSLPRVLLGTLSSILILGAGFGYHLLIEKRKKLQFQEYLNSEAHQGWMKTLKGFLAEKKGHR